MYYVELAYLITFIHCFVLFCFAMFYLVIKMVGNIKTRNNRKAESCVRGDVASLGERSISPIG